MAPPAQPGQAALPALPHHNPSSAVTPRSWCRPSPAHLPNPRARHGAAWASQARRATGRRRRQRVGATAPRACTMLLLPLLLLLMLLPLLALLERCLWHGTTYHGVAQRGFVMSQPGHPTMAIPWGATCPPSTALQHAPPPHVTSGGRGSRRGGRLRLPHPAPIVGPCAAESPSPWWGRVQQRPLPSQGLWPALLSAGVGGTASCSPFQRHFHVSWHRHVLRGRAKAGRCQHGERWSRTAGLLLGAALVQECTAVHCPQGLTRGV